jgi:hypothetical protein
MMKLRDWLKKLRRRSAERKGGDESSDSVNEAFTVTTGEAPASWIPSQQDRPRH